ncbi:MAG: GNAT family N-acetyltransferase [Lachnospirales bacterium]
MNQILETKRLVLREMEEADYEALCRILQDPEVMYAYEHAFSDEEVREWLQNQIRRYREERVGLWAVILKESGEMIGQCGLTLQPYGTERVVEVGYLFQKTYWHQGYAIEAAMACREYAFKMLKISSVYSIIRDNNLASQKVAERNGMHRVDQMIKHYYNMDMVHWVYRVDASEE